MKNRYKQSSLARFLYDHSLTFVSLMVLGLWIVLYYEADPTTHTGAFFGNAIADWSGTVLIVFATKWLFEKGSAESKKVPRGVRSQVGRLLVTHSLTIFIVLTGVGWIILYRTVDPMDKWGQVVGNIVSEWSQVLGMVLFTKVLIERGSKESR